MKQCKSLMLMFLLLSMVTISSAATLTVEKRTPNGGAAYGPFALTIMCTDSSVFTFSLAGGATGSFTYPDDAPIDCSISEALTGNQMSVMRSEVGDTYEDNDGRIAAPQAKLVEGQTLYVTNTIKGGGKPSSITSVTPASSIAPPPDQTDTTPSTLLASGPKVTVGTEDPYTCGAGFVGQISSEDIINTQVTIDLQQQGKSVKLFSPLVNAQGVYSQPINYTDKDSPIYVAAGSYAVIVTAVYKGAQDTVSFSTTITQECSLLQEKNPDYLEMLKERNKHIIDAQQSNNDTPLPVKKPLPPKQLPKTGAEIL